MQNHSYGYKFYLHVKENSFSYEWFCTWPWFEKEAKSNSEVTGLLNSPITELADNPMNQSKLEANTCNRRQARENAYEQVMIGFGFASDWLRKWRKIFYPITKRSNAKPMQLQNYFRHSIENRSNRKFWVDYFVLETSQTH